MKNILDKINKADEIQSKVELGTHEVELNIAEDLKKSANNDANKIATLKTKIAEVKALFSETKKSVNQSWSLYNGLKSLISQAGVPAAYVEKDPSVMATKEHDKFLTTIEKVITKL